MVRKLGSTRAMLRHLRKMHDNLIEGIIRPVTKRVTAIAGKPRGDDGFDIDDDSAWVEEVDEEDFDDYDGITILGFWNYINIRILANFSKLI